MPPLPPLVTPSLMQFRPEAAAARRGGGCVFAGSGSRSKTEAMPREALTRPLFLGVLRWPHISTPILCERDLAHGSVCVPEHVWGRLPATTPFSKRATQESTVSNGIYLKCLQLAGKPRHQSLQSLVRNERVPDGSLLQKRVHTAQMARAVKGWRRNKSRSADAGTYSRHRSAEYAVVTRAAGAA